ncbi:MAG: FtsX-like permease family protein, partial [Candidatus Dormibacteraeota bacterium]|nr:FtsX-like permease family protein [Candidatus Dormibacteraeota bacterium]
LLTAGLLVDQRAIETGLLHSRGASTGQIATMSLMEALVLALPAALAGPWLAVASLEVLNHIGPLAAVTVTLHPQVSPAAYTLAFVSALACVVALALPARQAARTFVQARTSRGRQLARSLLQRTRIDLILVAAAIIGLWQLRLYGAPITQTVQGSLGIDPLLVAAPAIGLLAGAVIALRAIPLLARLVDMAAPRARRLVPALGAWQLARRPNVYTRSALLLMLAIAIGVFALSYSSTWALSQQDQANYQVGADVRLQPDIRPFSSIPQLDLAAAHGQLAGVDATMPVLRDVLSPASATGGTLLAVDSTKASQIISLRPDLAAGTSGALMQRLAAKRPHLITMPLAGKPQQLALEMRVALDPPPPQPAGPPPPFGRPGTPLAPSIILTLQDGRGLLYQLNSQAAPADGIAHRLVWPLAFQMSNGRIATPQYPLSIADMEIQMQPGASRSGEIDLTGLQTSATLQGDAWAPGQLPSTGTGWSSTQFGLSGGAMIEPAKPQPPDGVAARFTSPPTFGFGNAQLSFRLTMEGGTVSDDLTALASQSFLDSTSTHVGDTVPVDLEGKQRNVHIAGALQGFPTVPADQA